MKLQGKSAIVTGGGRDIGRACVMELAAQGANVAINFHSSSQGENSAAAEIKAAIIALTRGLAKELGPKNPCQFAVPGMIDTDFHNTFTKPEVRAHVANITPLKREGSSEEVARAAVFLASDEASFITGANLDINGGVLFS